MDDEATASIAASGQRAAVKVDGEGFRAVFRVGSRVWTMEVIGGVLLRARAVDLLEGGMARVAVDDTTEAPICEVVPLVDVVDPDDGAEAAVVIRPLARATAIEAGTGGGELAA